MLSWVLHRLRVVPGGCFHGVDEFDRALHRRVVGASLDDVEWPAVALTGSFGLVHLVGRRSWRPQIKVVGTEIASSSAAGIAGIPSSLMRHFIADFTSVSGPDRWSTHQGVPAVAELGLHGRSIGEALAHEPLM